MTPTAAGRSRVCTPTHLLKSQVGFLCTAIVGKRSRAVINTTSMAREERHWETKSS
jgi:hypothetical protein